MSKELIEELRDTFEYHDEDNSSGCPGVSWANHARKWRAMICVDNQLIHLGYFDDLNDAVEAHKNARIKYHPTSPEALKHSDEDYSRIGKGISDE